MQTIFSLSSSARKTVGVHRYRKVGLISIAPEAKLLMFPKGRISRTIVGHVRIKLNDLPDFSPKNDWHRYRCQLFLWMVPLFTNVGLWQWLDESRDGQPIRRRSGAFRRMSQLLRCALQYSDSFNPQSSDQSILYHRRFLWMYRRYFIGGSFLPRNWNNEPLRTGLDVDIWVDDSKHCLDSNLVLFPVLLLQR